MSTDPHDRRLVPYDPTIPASREGEVVMEAAVPVKRLAGLEAQVEQISRRHQRAIGPTVRLVDTGRRDGSLAIVRLEGRTGRLGAWEIVCVLHHQDGLTRVEPRVPIGERQLELLSRARALCEACRTVRPRNQTFILRERSSGRTVQVGSSCLRPYTGVDSPAGPVHRAQRMAAATRAVGAAARNAGSPGEEYIDTVVFLAHAVSEVRSHGFSPNGTETATWRGALKLLELGGPPSIGDLRRAAEIRQWAARLAPHEPDGYRARLVANLARDRLSSRELPLAASAVRAYNRQLYWQIRHERATDNRGK